MHSAAHAFVACQNCAVNECKDSLSTRMSATPKYTVLGNSDSSQQGPHTANSFASTTTDPPLQQPCVGHSRQALPLLASITYTPHSTTKHARRDRQMCHQESISRRARRSCPGRFFVRSGVSSSLDEGCCRGRRPRAPGAGIPYRSGAISTPLPLLP